MRKLNKDTAHDTADELSDLGTTFGDLAAAMSDWATAKDFDTIEGREDARLARDEMEDAKTEILKGLKALGFTR